ncbi:MAG TPA: cadmium resistance transporter [Nitrososphaeraceae archaeon]|nr:cadmium resistance transporter [Nitrososphaeraceae archaeon]
MDFPAIVGVGIAAFVSTNIDDLLILIAFFATPRFPPFQIVLGQYIGMGSLIAVSLLGLLIALVVPRNLIGLIGLFPIAIGIKELLELHKKSNDYHNKDNEEEQLAKQHLQRSKKIAYLPFLTVAAVTFSGGEEIGIYTSLFATNNEVSQIIMLVSVVMVLTGFWCGLANYFVNHSFLADRFRHITARLLPFVLIGLGIYILVEAFF